MQLGHSEKVLVGGDILGR